MTMEPNIVQNSLKDFFISYNSADRAWAEWIAWELEAEGYSTVIQAWDIRPGSNFVLKMNEAANETERTIAVLSPDYLNAIYTQAEWQAAFSKDPRDEKGTLLPIRVRECRIEGLLGAIVYIDLVGLDEQKAREALLRGVERGRSKPKMPVLFPKEAQHSQPDPPSFPPQTATQVEQNQQVPSSNEQGELERRILEKDALDRNAITDKAVRHEEEDLLGFDVYVRALREFIASPDTSTPLTIGIDGPWGSGKTSLMRMVQNKLEKKIDSTPNFWSWLRDKWAWLKWFMLALISLPFWIFGKLLLWIEDKFAGRQQIWFAGIRVALAYDPTTDLDVDLKRLRKLTRFWAKIAAWHCPKPPQTHPTIWFNAWRFDQEEQLWAALALTVMDQIKQKYDPIGRIIFWFRLTLKRFSLLVALWNIIKRVLIPLILGLVAWQYSLYIQQLPKGTLQGFSSLFALGKPLLIGGAILSGLIQVISIAKDPFQIPVKDILDKPNYKEKVGFLGSFDTDFSHIVSLAIRPTLGWKPRKLVIFIDDLDRCEPPKSIDIIEGINLFLDSEGCVFVLGMDSTAVVASIETKYKDVFEKMKQETPGVVSPGRLFLDKIIQVPLLVPPPTEGAIEKLVDAITKRKASSPLSRLQKSTTSNAQANIADNKKGKSQPLPAVIPAHEEARQKDPASYAYKDVSDAIDEGAKLLTANPRQVKRFVNLFRLYVYIANELGMFAEYNRENGQEHIGLDLKRLAIWVAWSIRWAEIAKHLSDEVQLSISDLRGHLIMISKLVGDDGCWIPPERAVDLYPSQFEALHPLLGANHKKKFPHPIYEELIRINNQIQEATKNSASHWRLLPWQEWLRDPDFLKCIKLMESFWQQPMGNEVDWLANILRMTSITFPIATSIISNEKLSAGSETDTSQTTS